MERLTKKFTDGTFYCEDVEDVGIKGINSPTYVGKAINKLAEYEELEEQGLLLRLPCKVGDTVYLINHSICENRKIPLKCVVDEFTFDHGNRCYAVLNGAMSFYALRRFKAVNIDQFGLTVFLTKEEAEAIMDERNGR